jgi:hypothetical protein
MEHYQSARPDAGLNGDEERRELDPTEGGGSTATGGRRGSRAASEPDTPNEPVSQGKPELRQPRTGGRRGSSV